MKGVAVNVIELPAQLGFVPEVTATETLGAVDGITEIVTPALVAVLVIKQLALEVIVQVITSPFAGNIGVYETVVDALNPFFFHSYCVFRPPCIVEAKRVTGTPAHVGFVPLVSTIVTPGLTNGFTVMVIMLLVYAT